MCLSLEMIGTDEATGVGIMDGFGDTLWHGVEGHRICLKGGRVTSWKEGWVRLKM